MTAKLDGTNGLLQQYAYLAATTGFSYTFPAGTTSLIIDPAGTLATGTITMPAAPADGMTISFSSDQTITALTVSPNTGQSIIGNPTTMLAGGAATFVYRLSNTTWYAQASTAAIGNTGSAAPVVTIYTSPSPWTKPATLKAIKVTVVAGGGGGGTRGGGGGAAGYLFLQAPAIPGPVTVTVGAGGTGTVPPSPVPSPSGGTSSFGPLISATGGVGGARLPATPESAGGTITPSPTVIGAPGQYSGAIGPNTGGFSGLGFGFGGVTSQNAAGGYGGGGSATPTTLTPFSNGAAGVVVVEEFY
jgi:hypothetical protein